jgi:hypothetical protein
MLMQGSAFQLLSQRDGSGDRWGITCCANLCRHICRYALRFSVLIVFLLWIVMLIYGQNGPLFIVLILLNGGM